MQRAKLVTHQHCLLMCNRVNLAVVPPPTYPPSFRIWPFFCSRVGPCVAPGHKILPVPLISLITGNRLPSASVTFPEIPRADSNTVVLWFFWPHMHLAAAAAAQHAGS